MTTKFSMLKNVTIASLLLVLSSIILLGQTGIDSTFRSENKAAEKCTVKVDNLEICSKAETSFAENDGMVFEFSTTNLSDEDLVLPSFRVVLYDKRGKRLKTVFHTKDDPHAFIYQAFISHRFARVVKPKQTRKWREEISNVYKLKKGKYTLRINSRIKKDDSSEFSNIVLYETTVIVE